MRKLVFTAVLLITGFLTAQSAHAEYFGMINGRGGDLRNLADISVEAGFVTGDYDAASYDLIGARLNYRIIPGLFAYADLGKADISSFYDGTSLGFGVYYQLQDLIPTVDAAIKGSLHRVGLSGFGFSTDLDAISVEFLVSGQQPITENGLNWYANASINTIDSVGPGGSDTEPGIGGGIFMPVGPGEVFFGADFIDELMLGAGFRFTIR